MKKLTQQLLFTLICLCLSVALHAQDNEDSKYLVGAVPEIEGKVVFTKEFSIPSMSQEEIFSRVLNWMDTRLKQNENSSRVVLSDKENGQIVGIGDEWIVFSSSALSLDRTRLLYQLTVSCQPERCVLKVEKLRYIYREGKEKYTAEEWITDKYSLNKTQTKLIRGLAKWRRKTVDFIDDLCINLADALSATSTPTVAEEKKEEKTTEKSVAGSGPMVITPKQAVTIEPTKKTEEPRAEQTKATAVVTSIPPTNAVAVTPSQVSGYKEIAPDQLPTDAIQTGAGKLVIVIGNDPFNMTMMTANAGGSLGKVNNKTVIFSILSPDQAYEQVEKAEQYTIRFYPTGQTEPTIILECRKLPSPATMDGMPRTYIGEILKAMTR